MNDTLLVQYMAQRLHQGDTQTLYDMDNHRADQQWQALSEQEQRCYELIAMRIYNALMTYDVIDAVVAKVSTIVSPERNHALWKYWQHLTETPERSHFALTLMIVFLLHQASDEMKIGGQERGQEQGQGDRA